ncbi:hypothetical protein TNCV_2850271 [Trichonephila clavipes]|nr:hypothetical protein TNCV_2850271 [Trichonephila clavipes]
MPSEKKSSTTKVQRHFTKYVHPYATDNGYEFILLDDNAQSYQPMLIEKYLEDNALNVLERTERPISIPEFNRECTEYQE